VFAITENFQTPVFSSDNTQMTKDNAKLFQN